eukprot:1975991-Rhodomonas_salina.3
MPRMRPHVRQTRSGSDKVAVAETPSPACSAKMFRPRGVSRGLRERLGAMSTVVGGEAGWRDGWHC